MAALEQSSCCSREAQQGCCEPEAKAACCGESRGEAEACGCNERSTGEIGDVRNASIIPAETSG